YLGPRRGGPPSSLTYPRTPVREAFAAVDELQDRDRTVVPSEGAADSLAQPWCGLPELCRERRRSFPRGPRELTLCLRDSRLLTMVASVRHVACISWEYGPHLAGLPHRTTTHEHRSNPPQQTFRSRFRFVAHARGGDFPRYRSR